MSQRPDVFLSYSREDQATARRFADALTREGLTVWWDQTLRSGDAYDQVTEEALRGARAVVVLWSKNSVVSRWVRAEATLADRNRTLVPAMIEVCERPVMFELTQSADLSRWSGDGSDRVWQSFLGDVKRMVHAAGERVVAASIPSSPQRESASAASHAPSLAILPFTNRSGERADDVFAEGMVEDLVSALSLNSGLRVIARSATTTYRGGVSDLRSLGRELGVRYVLEGNVRRVGNSLRVTAQLVEAEDGAIVWMQKFDRPLAELAVLQEELVTEVASHLGVQVEFAEMKSALKKPGDLSAWEAVMRALAMSSMFDFGPESAINSLTEARRAVALAPDYPLANAVLAMWAGNLYGFTGGRDKALLREAQLHADKALKLAPNDPMVLSMSAKGLGNGGAWDKARELLERAIELNPNLADARQNMGQVEIWSDRAEEALVQIDLADQLAPRGLSTIFNGIARAYANYRLGRFEQALQILRKSLRAHPGLSFALNVEAVICERLGRHEEAHDAIRRLRESHPGLTLESIQIFNASSWLSPELAAETNALLDKAWREAGNSGSGSKPAEDQ